MVRVIQWCLQDGNWFPRFGPKGGWSFNDVWCDSRASGLENDSGMEFSCWCSCVNLDLTGGLRGVS